MDATELRKLADVEERHWWYAERRAVLRRLLRQYAARGVAADIGAAGGGNTRVLREAGLRAVAVEHNPEAAAIAHGRRIPTVRADAMCLPFRDASLDLVVAFDVFEHIVDDAGAMRQVARALVPGGLLLMAVPADPRLWTSHDEAVGHVRRYTRSGLRELIASAGLDVERVWSWNVVMRPALMVRRRHKTGSDLDQPPGLLNLALRAVVATERFLPVRSLPGVTLMLVGRRPR